MCNRMGSTCIAIGFGARRRSPQRAVAEFTAGVIDECDEFLMNEREELSERDKKTLDPRVL